MDGLIFAVFGGFASFGIGCATQVNAIANVCEKLVPFMAAFYVVGCFVILCINYDFIIPAVVTICKMAFTPGAAGGLVGRGIMMAMQYGIARGIFSNRMQAVFAENDKQDRNKENRRNLWKKNMG